VLSLGPLAFLQPWLLVGLLALPAIWLLLRLTPPAPRQVAFPPLALLLKLVAPEETPARTPWWLLLLRLAIAALIILGLATPVLNPAPELGGDGPVLLVVDDGWASAPSWPGRVDAARELLEQAERDNRNVVVLRTAPDGSDGLLEPRPAREVLEGLPGWQAKPWPVDHAAALAKLEALGLETARPIWLADGIADREDQPAATRALGTALAVLGELRIVADPPAERALLLRPGELAQSTQSVTVLRPTTDTAWPAELVAFGPDAEVLGRFPVPAAAAGLEVAVELELPLDIRNRIARLELTGGHGIGGVLLFDERWRRRTVGIAGESAAASDQPLLAEPYFVERALSPFTEIRRGRIAELIEAPLSLLVITDRGRLDTAEEAALTAWVEKGGVLLRFAGPRLAGLDGADPAQGVDAESDTLLPVPLRSGDRQLGGALSWSEPLPLAPFPPDGPFAGLEVNEEAIVYRQVLADPGPALADATLASLVDGTPIVTGRAIGEGWSILFHTTANTSWTSLPLSGVFVEMLRRIAELGVGAGSRLDGAVRVDRVLAADGSLIDPPAQLQPLDAELLGAMPVGPLGPAGLYAMAEQRTAGDTAERGRVARNLQETVQQASVLDLDGLARDVVPYREGDERNLMPLLLTLATLLALADLVVSFVLRGLAPKLGPLGQRARAAALAIGCLASLAGAAEVMAQDGINEEQMVELTLETRLAYVRTGLPDTDARSRQGLVGLGRVLEQRSSIETGEPVAIDPAVDQLAVFPLLYWPVPPEHPDLEATTLDQVETYLRQGGMVLFDTGDGGRLLPGQDIRGPGERRLGALLRGLDLSPLEPIQDDHVLTRSFYLMQDLPGRFAGRPIWVDRQPQSVNDGVSSVIIGAHDWAGAWAEDEYGRSLYPVVPGGERQREMARRFGVNLVMYALTGNYKTDQVHIPALLERLGQ
jgi:hypothetical protein